MSGVGFKIKTSKGGGAPPLASALKGPRRTPPNGGDPRNAPEDKIEDKLDMDSHSLPGHTEHWGADNVHFPPLEVVAEFIRGINFKPTDVVPVGSPGTVACMRTKNVQSELDVKDVWGVDRKFLNRENQILEEGDILVSSANSWNLVGKCCSIPELPWPTTFGGFVTTLRPHRAKIDPRYLYRWFSSERIQSTLRSFGQSTTSISNLNINRCLKLLVPLPPLPEQRRIAEVLDRAEGLRAKRRGCILQLESLTQSLFEYCFGDPIENSKGYPIRKMIDLIDPMRPISYGILMPGPEQDEGVKYIRVTDMKDGGIELSGVRKTTKEISNSFRRSLLKPGDLLMSIRGHVGRFAVVPEELDGANITQDTARLAIVGASSVFVRECLRTASFQRWMAKHTKGVAVRGINLGDVKLMPIVLPPRLEQDRFAKHVSEIDKLRLAHRASLAQLDALFASLQHRAFRGEL